MVNCPVLSPSELDELLRIFNAAAGLRFDHSAHTLLRHRLAARLAAHELESFGHYARLLRFGPGAEDELGIALDLVTTGETYFFRHQEQLDVVSDTILPAIALDNRASRKLTVWSAGCASGEEAYTLGIMLLESGLFDGWTIRVVGTDLSAERIEHARQGCYFQGAFRSTPDRLRDHYFDSAGRFWQVREEVRSLCHFSTQNLLKPDSGSFAGRVDVVLCRNVLLYLDDGSRQRVMENLYDRLLPGGYLLLGHSESLKFLNTPLELTGVDGDLAYRRPEIAHSRRLLR